MCLHTCGREVGFVILGSAPLVDIIAEDPLIASATSQLYLNHAHPHQQKIFGLSGIFPRRSVYILTI